MLTLFHGTARPDSNSRKIANYYKEVLEAKKIDHQFFSLESVTDPLFNKTYLHPKYDQQLHIENNILAPTTKYMFIIPEYNGSFPGMFKAFIDASDVKKCWNFKKAALTGVAEGRAGNLRGMEHLTNIFHHIKMDVHYFKIPISQVDKHLDENGRLNDPEMMKLIDLQIDLFMKY